MMAGLPHDWAQYPGGLEALLRHGSWKYEDAARRYVYTSLLTGEVVYVDKDSIRPQWRPVPTYDNKVRFTRRNSLAERWRRRMVRMQDKERERKKLFLQRVGWYVGLLWGTMFLIAATAWIFNFTIWSTLG